MSFFRRLFHDDAERDALRPLYAAIVAVARAPAWYRDGGVADTIDGRFDMVAAVLALVLLRLEADGERGRGPAARVTELFVADMDAQLREAGVGDVVVGKRIGGLMGALGGRLDAYRRGLAGGGLRAAVSRNVFRDAAPSDETVDRVAERLARLAALLGDTPGDALLAGRLPQP